MSENHTEKKKLLLVGGGGLGRVVSEWATRDYECSFVDDGIPVGTEVCNVPVIAQIPDLPELRKTYDMLVVTIGNNQLRERIYEKAEALGYTFPNIICSSVYISPFAKVGHGCVMLQNVVIQNGSSVGNGVVLNPGVEIHHDSFVDDNALIYTNSVIRTMARVGKRVRIGSNVTISNNVVVVDDADVKNGETLY